MREEHTKLLSRFFGFNIVFHIVLGIIIFTLFGFESNTLYYTLTIGVIIVVVNFTYWGYQFYKTKGKALYILGALTIVPFLFLIYLALKNIVV